MREQKIIEARRQELLAQLERYTQDGTQRVNWLTTQDDQVCAICAAREQRVLTIAEAQAELKGNFCESDNAELGCRCTLTVVENDFDEMP
jgi:hypothetical protein